MEVKRFLIPPDTYTRTVIANARRRQHNERNNR